MNGQFDIIYAGALIHLFKESDAHNVLNKFQQWLKTTGVLFINTTISEVTEEGFYYKNNYSLIFLLFFFLLWQNQYYLEIHFCS